MSVGRNTIVTIACGVLLWGDVLAGAKAGVQPTVGETVTTTTTSTFIPTEVALSQYALGATWFTYSAHGGLAYHWCTGPIETNLAGKPAALVELVIEMVQMPEVTDALLPWREQLRKEIGAANRLRLHADPPQPLVPIEIVNALWHARIQTHASEIAQAIPTMAMDVNAGGTCTTRPCDCTGWDECSVMVRDNYNVDMDIAPDPARRARVVGLGLGN